MSQLSQAAFWALDDYTLTWAVVEHTIDALFMIDIFINFRTTYIDDESNEVTNLAEIRQGH